MKKAQRIGSVVGLAAVSSLVLAGCGFGGSTDTSSGGSEGGSKVTLNMLAPTYSDKTKGLWETAIAGFTKENPDITIKLEMQSWDDLEKVISTKVQSNQAPDIYNGGPFVGFAADDLLYKADEITSPETLKDFDPGFLATEEYQGQTYALPLIASARALFINTELAEQAGVTTPPKTWDELLDAAKKITALGGVSGYGMPLGTEEAQAEAAVWLWGGGGSFGDAEKIEIDTPANLAGAEQIKKMIDAGVTQPDPGSTDRTPLLNIFIQGKIGMQVGLPPTVGMIKEKNPDLKYEIAPIPTKDGSPMTVGVGDQLMAFKNDGDAAKKDAITKFFDYFYSADNYTAWVSAEGFLPVTVSGSKAMASDEALKPFLDLLPDAKFYPTTNTKWSTADSAFKSLFGQLQTKPAADVLKEIQAKVDAG